MFIKACAVALVCSVVYLLINRMNSSLSFGVKLGAIVILGGVLTFMAEPVLSEIYKLSELSDGMSEYAGIVLRTVGVAILSHMCAEVCRDCQETSAASAVILAAKIEILILCLPLVQKIISYAQDILDM